MITILHTNDFHNRLTVPDAAVLKRARGRLGCRGLLIDAGDAVGSGNISYRGDGEPILDTMNDIGYDAMAVGNREFHLTRRGFQCKVARARFPVLCGNVRVRSVLISAKDPYTLVETASGDDPSVVTGHLVGGSASTSELSDTMPELPVVDFVVRTIHNGEEPLTVVIFAVTVPMITATMIERHVSNYLFEQPLAAANRMVPILKERYNPDLTVALTHIGIDQDRLLAACVSGIDLIVGGHSHTVLPDGEQVGETLIVHAGSHGRFVGRVDADVNVNIHSADIHEDIHEDIHADIHADARRRLPQGRLSLQATLIDVSSLVTSEETERQFHQSLP